MTSLFPLPTTLEHALSPEWLTVALGQQHPGIEVTGVTIGPTMYSCRSVPQMPHQSTSTRTSSRSLIAGTSTSSMRMSDLPWNRAARTGGSWGR